MMNIFSSDVTPFDLRAEQLEAVLVLFQEIILKAYLVRFFFSF